MIVVKKFVVGMKYNPEDRSYSPILVIKRTKKCIVVQNDCGSVWRMVVRNGDDGVEYVVDSSVPARWRDVFTYRADDVCRP